LLPILDNLVLMTPLADDILSIHQSLVYEWD